MVVSESAQTDRIAVVLTALEVETRAVLRQLGEFRDETVSGTGFFRGQFEGWDVAVAEVGAGNARAAAIAARALGHYKPIVALFVGVAGGAEGCFERRRCGCSQGVCRYESGKGPGSRGSKSRAWTPLVTAHDLDQRARVLRQRENWKKRLNTGDQPRGPRECASDACWPRAKNSSRQSAARPRS